MAHQLVSFDIDARAFIKQIFHWPQISKHPHVLSKPMYHELHIQMTLHEYINGFRIRCGVSKHLDLESVTGSSRILQTSHWHIQKKLTTSHIFKIYIKIYQHNIDLHWVFLKVGSANVSNHQPYVDGIYYPCMVSHWGWWIVTFGSATGQAPQPTPLHHHLAPWDDDGHQAGILSQLGLLVTIYIYIIQKIENAFTTILLGVTVLL